MKIGDRVRIKSVEELEDLYGVNVREENLYLEYPNVKYQECVFGTHMSPYCSYETVIREVRRSYNNKYDLIYLEGLEFYFIEPWLSDLTDSEGNYLLNL